MERTKKFPLDNCCEFQTPGRDRPIGVFDSGVGGLILLKALSRRFPNERFIYYADTAYLPYGIRTRKEISDRVTKAFDYFKQQSVKLVVVPCHTASLCGAASEETFSFPVIYISDCLLDELKETSAKALLLLATKAALNHGQYEYRVRNQLPLGTPVHALSCPKFVDLAENSTSLEAILHALSIYFAPLDKSFTHCLLGCTHYIYFKRQIEEYFNGKIFCCDGVEQCCEKVDRLLTTMSKNRNTPLQGESPGYIHHNTPASISYSTPAAPKTALGNFNSKFSENNSDHQIDQITFVVTGNNSTQFLSRAGELLHQESISPLLAGQPLV